MHSLPANVEVHVEVPLGGFVKWGSEGRVDYVSPLPSPFNYGSVPALPGGDGDPLDAVVLGRRLPRGHVGRWPVLGVVRFVDDGHTDDKLICGERLGRLAWWRIKVFFRTYALLKTLAGRPSTFGGVVVRHE